MNLEERKKNLIERVLTIQNENIISQIENILNSENTQLDSRLQNLDINNFKKLDEDSQIEYISDLEFSDESNFKWNLFNEILMDTTISDLTRIEILNVLGASDIPKKEKDNFINLILKNIEDRNEDETFISHCIMTLQNEDLFSSEVYLKMKTIFLNQEEDIDLRSNAHLIISNNTNGEKLIEYYNGFIEKSDPIFSEHSKRWIDEINKGIKNGDIEK